MGIARIRPMTETITHASTTQAIQPGAGLNWNATSDDYARFRPTYPASYFDILRTIGIGRPGQQILDLGAGTGALALPFARAGAQVVALDASAGQLEKLRLQAGKEGVGVRTIHARAEETGLPSGEFDAVTASMCWDYFDPSAIREEVRRLLKPDGLLLVSSLLWAPEDPIAKETDALMLRYNPDAGRSRRDRLFVPVPAWCEPPFKLRGYLAWREALPFTPESWRGRIRASKWIGAALPPDRVEAFDHDHAALIARLASATPGTFGIQHDIVLRVARVEE
jgi:2-polyprenyl-3-methyl-5-hydroxy-6-metoxy-1,4-benzoquinol methylase